MAVPEPGDGSGSAEPAIGTGRSDLGGTIVKTRATVITSVRERKRDLVSDFFSVASPDPRSRCGPDTRPLAPAPPTQVRAIASLSASISCARAAAMRSLREPPGVVLPAAVPAGCGSGANEIVQPAALR